MISSIHRGIQSLLAGIGFLILTTRLPAQPPQVDQAMQVNKFAASFESGAEKLMKGILDRDGSLLDSAIQSFGQALEIVPEDSSARLMVAICHGQKAELHRHKSYSLMGELSHRDFQIRYMKEAEFKKLLDDQIEQLRESIEQTDSPQRKANRKVGLKYLMGWTKETALGSDEERKRRDEVRKLVEAEAEQYAVMEPLVAGLMDEKPMRLTAILLRALCLIKIGRIEVELAAGNLDTKSVKDLRASASKRLQESVRLLELYLSEAQDGADRIRARFYQAVVNFRLAVPRAVKDEELEIDSNHLAEAGRLFLSISSEGPPAFDPATSEDKRKELLTYFYTAEYYLALVRTLQAANQSLDAEERGRLLDEAKQHLDRALELDWFVPEQFLKDESVSSIPGDSISGGAMAQLVAAQLVFMKEVGARPIVMPKEDVEISLDLGPRYDTNVILLGERTDLPRGVDDESDFGLRAGQSITYELDLEKYGGERWRRWTVAGQLRLGQLWNVDAHEFDEQDYGGGVAVRYTLHDSSDPNERISRAYALVTYDYDYFLLGRDKFVDAHRLAAYLQWYSGADDKHETNLGYIHNWRDYNEEVSDPRLNRDGVYPRFELAHSWKLTDMKPRYEARGWTPWGHRNDDALEQEPDSDFPKRYLEAHGAIQYGWDSTDGDDFDQKAIAFLLALDVPVPYGWTLSGSCGFEWQDYSQPSSIDFHRREREDFIQRYGLSLSRLYVLRGGAPVNRLTKTIDRTTMAVLFGVFWTLDDSNVVDRLGEGIFEYDRIVYNAAVRFTFN